MEPTDDSFSGTLLHRLDLWNQRGKWLDSPEDPFPSKVFWGIFLWNLPLLVISFIVIGVVFYRAAPDPMGVGWFTPLNWMVEVVLLSLTTAGLLDWFGCLWLRRLWNRRARTLRQQTEAQ